MVRYLATYTDTDKWETLKDGDVRSVLEVIEGLEFLSEEPTLENIYNFKQTEKAHFEAISELDADDRLVLEEMINKVIFQSYRANHNNYTRWLFALERATDLKIEDDISKVNVVVNKAQKLMDNFAATGDADVYSEQLEEVLNELDTVWADVQSELDHLSPCWLAFFEENVERKRNVIVRHMEHFRENGFGFWLESIRAEREWSLAKAEKETGVSASYIHRLEKGHRGVPSFGKLRELASGYDVSFETVIAMATDGVKELDEYIEDGIFEMNDMVVSPKVQYDLAEMIRALKSDDMVSAHLKLDDIARQIHG